jgi:DNA-binding protein
LDTILLKAAGNAISTLCVASEVIRRRIPGLHQVNHLTSVDITDEYDNREEGPTKVNRKLTLLEIKLTKKPE